MEPLARLENEIKKCVKCGACRAHCPAFSVMGREPVSARGKVALARGILSGAVAADKRSRLDMSKCLLCGLCVEKCANDVPTDLIVLAAREAVVRAQGLTPFSRVVGFLLRRTLLMNAGALLAAILSPIFMRKIPHSSGMRLRFPFGGIGRRHFPSLPSKPFMDRYPEVIEGLPGKPRIAYFVGCMTNYAYPGIGDAAVSILKSLGCTIIIPTGQQCCGFPALAGGDMETFRRLAEANLAALEASRPDYVMTACASCGGAFHRIYPKVIGERFPELASRCLDLAEKSVDASVLLLRLGFHPSCNNLGPAERITYHDPCHLRGRGITRQPRELLRSLAGERLVEMKAADTCCGLGGTFNFHHYGPSMGINAAKSEAIEATGATIVATGCPGCMHQLNDGLLKRGGRIRVMHTLEFLARQFDHVTHQSPQPGHGI
jgi:glycolate oxidase iron-sulfur subunit